MAKYFSRAPSHVAVVDAGGATVLTARSDAEAIAKLRDTAGVPSGNWQRPRSRHGNWATRDGAYSIRTVAGKAP